MSDLAVSTPEAERFRSLLRDDPRYDPEAYHFVYDALDWTLEHVVNAGKRRNHHVTGRELLEGIRQLAILQFGCLARTVFKHWGIHTTDDWGEIVFNLVDHGLMGKQESDSKEDFAGIYDFDQVFRIRPVFRYSRERDEWKASYVREPCE